MFKLRQDVLKHFTIATSWVVTTIATISPVASSTRKCNFRQVRRLLTPCWRVFHFPFPCTFTPVEYDHPMMSTSTLSRVTSWTASRIYGRGYFDPVQAGQSPSTQQDLRKNHWDRRLLELRYQVVGQQTMLDLINCLPPLIRKCLQPCPDQQRTSNVIALNPRFAARQAFTPVNCLSSR